MARPQGIAGHRTEVVGTRLTAEERKRLVTDRKGSLSESAYVRWVLTRAADVNPHHELAEEYRQNLLDEYSGTVIDDE
jgi:hypothetical protein